MKLNGKMYTMGCLADFNVMADLQKNGCNIGIINTFTEDVKTKPLYALRELVAIVCNMTPTQAGQEVQIYLKSGGTVDKLIKILESEIDEYIAKYIDVKPTNNKVKRLFRK